MSGRTLDTRHLRLMLHCFFAGLIAIVLGTLFEADLITGLFIAILAYLTMLGLNFRAILRGARSDP